MQADWKLKIVNKNATVEVIPVQVQGEIPRTKVVHKVVMASTLAGTNAEFGFITTDAELAKDFVIGEMVDIRIKTGKVDSKALGLVTE
jgi:hypothetical protein